MKAANYDHESEQQAKEWIESVTGEKFTSASFQESIKDGVLLCKLANKVCPGSNIKIQTSKMPFKQVLTINDLN